MHLSKNISDTLKSQNFPGEHATDTLAMLVTTLPVAAFSR